MTSEASSETTEYRELDLSGVRIVEVAAFNGDVSVYAGAEHTRLAAVLRGKATYVVERLGNLLYVSGQKRGLIYSGSMVSFTLWLPAGLALKLGTIGAAIRVVGEVRAVEASTHQGAIETAATGEGKLHLRIAHGPIDVRGARGRIDVATANGGVQIAGCQGKMLVATANGGVEMRDCQGEMDVATSHGSVQMADIQGEIQVATSKGDVRLERVSFMPGSRNAMKTSSGVVELLGVRAPGGLSIQARTAWSPIQADLDGYEIQATSCSLSAHRAGSQPASLNLVAVDGIRLSG